MWERAYGFVFLGGFIVIVLGKGVLEVLGVIGLG